MAQLQQQAGLKESIPSALLMAVMAVLGGSTVWNAAKIFNIDAQQIQQMVNSPSVREWAEEQMTEPTRDFEEPTPSEPIQNNSSVFDRLISLIMRHENLLPKQTPFRITSPSMRNWNSIHGFPIDHQTPVPSNRRNFIFLQNPSDVPKAIAQQFANYSRNPNQYGLDPNPSLKDALRVFDQQNANGKMSYIKNSIPSIDFNQPLSSFLN